MSDLIERIQKAKAANDLWALRPEITTALHNLNISLAEADKTNYKLVKELAEISKWNYRHQQHIAELEEELRSRIDLGKLLDRLGKRAGESDG